MQVTRKINNDGAKYYEFFRVLNLLYGWKLSDRQLRVLSIIYNFFFYYKHKNVNLEFEEIKHLVYNKENRNKILKSLGINYEVFMNIKSELKRKGFLDKNDIINKNFYIDIINTDKLTIKYEKIK